MGLCITQRLAKKYRDQLTADGYYGHASAPRADGYAACMKAKLRQDWETIRLLTLVDDSCHPGNCEGEMWTNDRPGRNGKLPVRKECTCGLRAHLQTLKDQFK